MHHVVSCSTLKVLNKRRVSMILQAKKEKQLTLGTGEDSRVWQVTDPKEQARKKELKNENESGVKMF